MTKRTPRYSHEVFALRGQEIYNQSILPSLTADDDGKFVAIDIESGLYEMDLDDFTATERLRRRSPDAQMWLCRVGQRAAYRIGPRS